MIYAKNPKPFPAKFPWEDFLEERVTIAELRDRAPNYENTLTLSFLLDRSTPILPSNAVTMLLSNSEIGLSIAARKKLDRDLRAIGLWFLMPRGRRVVEADVDSMRATLKKVARLSRDIEQPLATVLDVIGLSVAEELEQDPDWKMGELNYDHAAIRQFIKSLPGVIDRLSVKVEARRKGRRSNFILDNSVALASAAFERAKRAIQGRAATLGKQPRIVGDGAKLFVEFFKMLDPRLTEEALALSLRRSLREG